MSYDDVLDAYGAAWNEGDEAARRSLLETSWADEGTYCDPTAHVSGRDALVAHIGACRAAYGDFRIDRTSAYDAHHDYVRFTWTMVSGAGETLVDGFDVVGIAADGRVELVVGFFGPFPT